MLRQVERYLPALEIDVFPCETVLLAPSHPCTQGDIELVDVVQHALSEALMPRTAGIYIRLENLPEPNFFRVVEPADEPGGDLLLLDVPRGVYGDLVAPFTVHVDRREYRPVAIAGRWRYLEPFQPVGDLVRPDAGGGTGSKLLLDPVDPDGRIVLIAVLLRVVDDMLEHPLAEFPQEDTVLVLHQLRRSPDGLPCGGWDDRSEEHTSELQSLRHLVCRLLLE